MADDLDSIVKGAPVAGTPAAARNAQPPGGTTPILQPFAVNTSVGGKQHQQPQHQHGDPLNHAPSAPSMVYLNLLILEASLRAQFLELRARRRHHTFLALLTAWVALFAYKLYLAPREDDRGLGGSIYWAVEGVQKVCFMGGIITAVLVWATGIWDRGVRWPRRWFAIANRGLRVFNCKLVLVRRPWWAEALSTLAFFLTYGFFSHTASSYRHVDPSLLRDAERELQLAHDAHPVLLLPHDDEERAAATVPHEEDLTPGGDYVKLLLLAKPFSPTFRENWELYRTEYWERENERRALLRAKVKQHQHRLAKQAYGWLWWLPLRQPPQLPRRHDHHRQQHPARHLLIAEKGRKRRSSNSAQRLSVPTSRSHTPTLDEADDPAAVTRRPSSSSSTSASEKRRKPPGSASRTGCSGTESRSVTPEIPSPLARGTDVAPYPPADEARVLRSGNSRHGRGSGRDSAAAASSETEIAPVPLRSFDRIRASLWPRNSLIKR